MSVILTSTLGYSDVVKYEQLPEFNHCKKAVVVNGVAMTMPIGTVLGKVTATGKYKLCTAGAADGSQVAAAVIVGDSTGRPNSTAVVLNTDTKFIALVKGVAYVSDVALTKDASITAGALTTTMYDQLEAAGINVLTTI